MCFIFFFFFSIVNFPSIIYFHFIGCAYKYCNIWKLWTNPRTSCNLCTWVMTSVWLDLIAIEIHVFSVIPCIYKFDIFTEVWSDYVIDLYSYFRFWWFFILKNWGFWRNIFSVADNEFDNHDNHHKLELFEPLMIFSGISKIINGFWIFLHCFWSLLVGTLYNKHK